jgi:hypothetical protein
MKEHYKENVASNDIIAGGKLKEDYELESFVESMEMKSHPHSLG